MARRLRIAGEVDRSRLAREIGVSSQTVYNVLSDLRLHGYTLSIDVNAPGPTSPTSPPNSPTPTSPSTLQPTLEEVQSSSQSRLPEETNSSATLEAREESSSREVQSRRRYYPGETTLNEEPAQSRSDRAPRVATQEPSLTRQDVTEIVGEAVTGAVGEAMKKLIESISPEVKRVEEPTQRTVQLPIEDVQLSGEKVNYRIALNPEIFFS